MRDGAWACRLVIAVLSVGTVSCSMCDVPNLSPPKPPGLPIFAGNLTSGGRLLNFKKAKYPAELRHLGYQEVRLRCKVLEDGTVTEITYEGGQLLLFPAARAAVERWRYAPRRLYDPFTGKSNAISYINSVQVPFYGLWP